MSLLLTLEQGPRTQAVRQTRLDEGELVIGRSPEADWQIDDPDMFVSRAHCKITSRDDGYFVTDMSTSGLFIDDAGSPLGAGNSTRLKNGMRLRLGDYVLWVDLQAATTSPSMSAAASHAPASIDGDDFFSLKAEEEPQRARPRDLPNPFEQPEAGAFSAFQRASAGERGSSAFDDPFSLDPVATPVSNGGGGQRSAPASKDPFGFDSVIPDANAEPEIAWQKSPTFDDDFSPGPAAASRNASGDTDRREAVANRSSAAPWDLPAPSLKEAPASRPRVAPMKPSPQAASGPTDMALRAAFLRGMGLDETDVPARDPIVEMEKFGREYRMMVEGLMQLLRKRAEEKGNARVAQTVVGASEVNPLKFLPTVDDALATILAERSPGFLAGEPALGDAIRDLAQHHVRTWRGIQGALRRMIDHFDPAALEEELKSSSTIETLLAGGRAAKLWELYRKRHHEIAMSAESRFMGDIGADFRKAYEEE